MTSTLERFQQEVGNHSMEVLHDEGIYRHLRFSEGGSAIYHFNITTWPGYLCISGDMGCYTFARIRDMFEFFREGSDQLRINPGYWREKIQAGPSTAPLELTKDWSVERFREQIRHYFESYSDDLDDEAKAELWEAIEDEVLRHEGGGHEAMQAAMDFQHKGFRFEDFFEHDCTEWSTHYLWCCYAIVWAIRQYDQQEVATCA